MKNKKINLEEIQIQSFVTNLRKKQVDTLKGGRSNVICIPKTGTCPSDTCPVKSEGCYTENPDDCETFTQGPG